MLLRSQPHPKMPVSDCFVAGDTNQRRVIASLAAASMMTDCDRRPAPTQSSLALRVVKKRLNRATPTGEVFDKSDNYPSGYQRNLICRFHPARALSSSSLGPDQNIMAGLTYKMLVSTSIQPAESTNQTCEVQQPADLRRLVSVVSAPCARSPRLATVLVSGTDGPA